VGAAEPQIDDRDVAASIVNQRLERSLALKPTRLAPDNQPVIAFVVAGSGKVAH
jgi:hypothetical protein